MPRDTRTGGVLEQMILPALRRGGYDYSTQVVVGRRLGGGRHYVDVVADKAGARLLISLKWQQVPGTAEQKVPFEAVCLAAALEGTDFAKAFLVLGGEGWKLREFYTSGGLDRFLTTAPRVEIVTLEAFVARANSGRL